MKPECEAFVIRLCDGVTPASDTALAEHVGSCLDCFRTMTELRDVARLADALRAEPAPDPGEAFWTSFPARVYRAQADSRRPTVDGGASVLGGLLAWVRRPFPAAICGGALSAAIVLIAVFGFEEKPKGPMATTATAGLAAPTPVAADVELPPADDIAELDVPALEEIVGLIVDDDDDVTEFVHAVSDDEGVLSPVQRLESLDDDALRALDRALREVPI